MTRSAVAGCPWVLVPGQPAWGTLETGYVGVAVGNNTGGVYGGVKLSFEVGLFVNWEVAGDPPPVWVYAVVVSAGGRHRVYDYRCAAAAGVPFPAWEGPLHARPVAGEGRWRISDASLWQMDGRKHGMLLP